MQKFRHAIFCYYVLGFDCRLHKWLLLIVGSIRQDGFMAIDDADRKRIAQWVADLFTKKMDFDTILHILTGDAFVEKNKADVIKLQTEVGKNITELWDTDPIFDKYPHLRGMGRNKEFEEKIWPAIKSKIAENQK